MILKRSLVSTLSQLIGRLANFALPLLFIGKFGGSETSDLLFVTLAVVFFFGTTLSNAASDAFTPGLSNKHICIADNKWHNLVISLSIISCILVIVIVFSFNWYTFCLALISLFLVYVGLSSSLQVSKLYFSGDFLTPGISWSFRWIAVIPIIFLSDQALAALGFLFSVLIADTARLLFLLRCANNVNQLNFEKEKKVLSSDLVLWYMFSSSLAGLNPLVDRFVASYLGEGAVSQLELIERIASLFLLVPTVGLMQVLNVEINKKVKNYKNWKSDGLLFMVLVFSVIWSLLCLLMLWLLGDLLQSLFDVDSLGGGESISYGLIVLAAMAPALFVGMIGVRILLALNKGRLVFYLSGLSLVINAAGSIPLGFLIGVNGILLATIFTYSVTALLLVFACSKSTRKAA